MDTRLLRTFLVLARTGSFTATAAELHLAQSTVTVQVRSLEKTLGTRLFDRLPRRAVLTDAGRRLLDRAGDVLAAESDLLAAAGDGPVTGRVVIGAGETLCSARLPGLVAALRRTHPQVEVELWALGTADAVAALGTGAADVALLLEDEPEVAGIADIVARRLGREPLRLLCAADHPLAHASSTWEDLAHESFFLHEQGCSYSDRLARRLLAVPGARPRITRFGSIEAARSCVAAGLGLTVLPLANAERSLRDGRLAVVPGPSLPDVTVHVARHRRRWVSPATRVVLDELARHFGAQV